MKSKRVARRQLLRGGGAALLGLAAGARPASGQVWKSGHSEDGKRLMRYGERSRFVKAERYISDNKVNMEMHGDMNGFDALTPLDEQTGIITPSSLHFVSSHGNAPPDIDPQKHRLMIHGMVERPLIFTMEELKRLPSITRIHYIECRANSPRAGEERTLQQNHGWISCSEWTGVPLSLLLKEAGVKPGATWVLGESAEPTKGAKSIPLGKAMLDVLIAYGQNGEPVRPHNGYPLRLVAPGFEGNFQVKWLEAINVVDRPYATYWEHTSFVKGAGGNMPLGNYWEQGPKSVITSPAGGQRLSSHGYYQIVGFAWSGNGAVRRVEVSIDGGRTWSDAQIQDPALPMALTRFQLPWRWNGAEAVLQSRCTDDRGQVQPTKANLTAFWGDWGPPHGNPIQPWRVTRDGQVFNAL